MPSIHASVDLSYIPINLKLLEYLSHSIRKWLFLDSDDNPSGSGLGTVSTYISSSGYIG